MYVFLSFYGELMHPRCEFKKFNVCSSCWLVSEKKILTLAPVDQIPTLIIMLKFCEKSTNKIAHMYWVLLPTLGGA